MSLYLINTRLNLTSSLLDQNNPKSKYWCKNELIYIKDFEAVQKTKGLVLSALKTRGAFCSFFKQYISRPPKYFTKTWYALFDRERSFWRVRRDSSSRVCPILRQRNNDGSPDLPRRWRTQQMLWFNQQEAKLWSQDNQALFPHGGRCSS